MIAFDPFTLTVGLIALPALFGQSIGIAMLCGTIVYLGPRRLRDLHRRRDAAAGAVQRLHTACHSSVHPRRRHHEHRHAGRPAPRFSQALVGRFRGGLGHVNVVASLIFSGMSGSAVADAVGMGRIIINLMTKDGKYTPSYAAAITAASATIGPIIPPSIPMVLYALVSDTSIGYLFAGGSCRASDGRDADGDEHRDRAPAQSAHRRSSPAGRNPGDHSTSLPGALLPIILLGGIYGGVMTPTEAAAVAAFYALVISVFLYRAVSLRQFYDTLLSSARSTATVGLLIAGALAFNFVVTREDVPNKIAAFMQQFDLSQAGFLLVINILFLILGCIMEAGAILVIIVPIFIPTVLALGIDPVHFGVVVVVNSMIGLITPPYGLLLFIVAGITNQPIGRVVRDLVPFIFALIAALMVITFVPDFVLFIPRLLGYKG